MTPVLIDFACECICICEQMVALEWAQPALTRHERILCFDCETDLAHPPLALPLEAGS